MRRAEIELQISNNVAELIEHITHYLDVFAQVDKFTGPSIYFHHRTIQRLRTLGLPSAAVQDEPFLEYLYATLTAWGLHRMGPKGAKLAPFDTFAGSLRSHGGRLDVFYGLRIESVAPSDISALTDSLWEIMESLEVSATESKIVAGSKTLHHILPDLVPPIDREHTGDFFLWQNQMQYRQREMFTDVFPRLVTLARAIVVRVDTYLGSGFNTSLPKVVDNAVMGFVVGRDSHKSAIRTD